MASDIIKQAVILAGGKSDKIESLSEGIPKPMITFNGKPFLEYLLEMLKEQGIERVLLLLVCLPEVIKKYFGNGEQYGISIEYSIASGNDETGRRVLLAKDKIDEKFILLNCDNYWPMDLRKMIDNYNSRQTLGQLTLYSNKYSYLQPNVMLGSDGIVEKYDKTGSSPDMKHVDIGFGIFDKKVINLIPENENVSFESIVYSALAQKKQLSAYISDHKCYTLLSQENLPGIKRVLERAPAIILSRDGVLIEKPSDSEDVKNSSDFKWVPGSKRALFLLKRAGYKLIMTASREGVCENDLNEIHNKMKNELVSDDVDFAAVYCCNHGKDEDCDCRKPKPGMLFTAQNDLDLDLSRTIFIGYDEMDLQAGNAAGCKTMLVSDDYPLIKLIKDKIVFPNKPYAGFGGEFEEEPAAEEEPVCEEELVEGEKLVSEEEPAAEKPKKEEVVVKISQNESIVENSQEDGVKNILLTGNMGYTGTVIVTMLLKMGYNVTGLDVGYYGNDCMLYIDSGSLDFKQVVKDIRDLSEKDCEGIDAVVHLASLADDSSVNQDRSLIEEINYKASVKLGESAKRAGVKRFIYSSSQSVYGASETENELDEDAKKNPLTAYSKAKWEAECKLLEMSSRSFAVVVFRPFVVFGISPKFRCDTVFNRLMACAYTTGKIEIKGDGSQWKPAVHLEDLSNAYISGLKAPLDLVAGQSFNVGVKNGNYTLREMAETAQSLIKGSKIELTEEEDNDSSASKVSFNKILTRLKNYYKPKWDLQKGGRELVELFKEVDFSKNQLNSRICIRLNQMDYLIKEGVIDKNLRFISDRGCGVKRNWKYKD